MALLCTLRLLRQLPPDAQPAVHCHVFACPAIGNEALALYVKKMGWERYFSNMLIPGIPMSSDSNGQLHCSLQVWKACIGVLM